MLKPDKPVRGSDINRVERLLGYSQIDMQWLLGVPPGEYYRLRSETPGDDPASGEGATGLSISQAMVLRTLADPEADSPIPQAPGIGEFYEFLSKNCNSDFTPRHLGVLLGRDGTAGYRWMRSARNGIQMAIRAEGARWMMLIYHRLKSIRTREDRKLALMEMYEAVIREAELRGYDPDHLRRKFELRRSKAATGRAKRSGKRTAAKAAGN